MAIAYSSHPLASTHALIMHGDRILLVKRGRPPYIGYWGLPGGGVELGETVVQALHREVQEETGLQLTAHQYLGYADAIEHDGEGRVRYHYVILYFRGDVADTTVTAGDDAAEARWVTVAEARQLPLTDAVERCLSWAGLI